MKGQKQITSEGSDVITGETDVSPVITKTNIFESTVPLEIRETELMTTQSTETEELVTNISPQDVSRRPDNFQTPITSARTCGNYHLS